MSVITARRTTTDERLGTGGAVIMLIAFVALLVVLWSGQLSTPNHVPHLTVDNPNDWSANVEVRRAGGDAWTAIGALGPRLTRDYLEVLDVGETWELRFHSPGGAEVRTTVTRDQLTADSWKVVVPPSLAAVAASAGLPRSSAEPSGGAG